MSDTHTWLVTGTNRGIGFEIVKQLVASPTNIVIAACRKPEAATALQGLVASSSGRLHIIALDITDAASITASVDAAKGVLEEHGLDYLINNAAINLGEDSAFTLKEETLLTTFKANVVGPALTAQAYLPYLEKSKRKVVMNLSSGLGSIASNFGPQLSSYSVSKSALNMLAYKQATEKPELISFVIDPGWVQTDMGGPNAVLPPHESVAGLLKVITSATKEQSGKYFKYDGETVPW
ncbi:NAD(P)-binding protein [Artomyces pyxidatus]|uniref:NAD(P)-binding protein n=1 Tax=Artomyces pyxidatus TaxID=48021 RepID=A0ACB8T644_9AGAM|nr:NAD(P)-binding protein [Artomyces pyxidatus]